MLAVLDHPALGYNKEFLISCLFNNLAFFTQFGFFSDMVWLFSQEMSGNPVLCWCILFVLALLLFSVVPQWPPYFILELLVVVIQLEMNVSR